MKQKNNNENISKDRKKYIRKIKIRKLEILFTQITIIIAFIAIWEILANNMKPFYLCLPDQSPSLYV